MRIASNCPSKFAVFEKWIEKMYVTVNVLFISTHCSFIYLRTRYSCEFFVESSWSKILLIIFFSFPHNFASTLSCVISTSIISSVDKSFLLLTATGDSERLGKLHNVSGCAIQGVSLISTQSHEEVKMWPWSRSPRKLKQMLLVFFLFFLWFLLRLISMQQINSDSEKHELS